MMIIGIIFLVITLTNEDKIDTYLLGAFIATQIMLFLFSQRFENRRSARNEKKEHAQDICQVYKLLTIAEIEQGMHKRPWGYSLKFARGYTPILHPSTGEPTIFETLEEYLAEDELKHYPNYDYYEAALKHLEHREYKCIYTHWEKTKNLLDELNDKTSIEERLQGALKEKMSHYFPALQSAASGIKSSDNYNAGYIIQFIMNHFRERDPTDHALASLAYGESDGTKSIYPQRNRNESHIIMGSDGNLDFETYKKLVKEMLDDTSLKDFYNEFTGEYKNITKELNDFRDELNTLVNKLKIGVPLEGKCKGCPS